MQAWISDAPLSAQDVLDRVGGQEDGAVLVFLGTVRYRNRGRIVEGMRYEAYRAMAEDVLRGIASAAAERIGSDRIAVCHRIGELAVGDVSVAIAVSTPHRAQAFDGCRYIIEEIKQRLPVWKQEQYGNGEAEWLDGTHPPAVEAHRE